MRPYFLSSAVVHFSAVAFFLLFSWLHRPNIIMIDTGFEFEGTGGGGDGRASAGGPKVSQIGQVVPAPVKIPLPEKPAPVQKPVEAEEQWAVKNAKVVPPTKEIKPVETPVERGPETQKEQTNIIRRGVDPNTKAGDGYDFGPGDGTGKGLGIGLGIGPGEGGGFGGFGSYLKILRQRIWSEWTQSAVYGSEQICVVGLTVARGGDVSDVKVEKPSGNSFYDNVALRAVRNASPLPPLPPSFSKDSQRFRIQFRLLE